MYVRALTKCNELSSTKANNEKGELCSNNDLRSNKIEIGIKSTMRYDTSYLKPGNLNKSDIKF